MEAPPDCLRALLELNQRMASLEEGPDQVLEAPTILYPTHTNTVVRTHAQCAALRDSGLQHRFSPGAVLLIFRDSDLRRSLSRYRRRRKLTTLLNRMRGTIEKRMETARRHNAAQRVAPPVVPAAPGLVRLPEAPRGVDTDAADGVRACSERVVCVLTRVHQVGTGTALLRKPSVATPSTENLPHRVRLLTPTTHELTLFYALSQGVPRPNSIDTGGGLTPNALFPLSDTTGHDVRPIHQRAAVLRSSPSARSLGTPHGRHERPRPLTPQPSRTKHTRNRSQPRSVAKPHYRTGLLRALNKSEKQPSHVWDG